MDVQVSGPRCTVVIPERYKSIRFVTLLQEGEATKSSVSFLPRCRDRSVGVEVRLSCHSSEFKMRRIGSLMALVPSSFSLLLHLSSLRCYTSCNRSVEPLEGSDQVLTAVIAQEGSFGGVGDPAPSAVGLGEIAVCAAGLLVESPVSAQG